MIRGLIAPPTSAEMAAIAAIVYEESGIRLTAMKTALVNARLQKRLRTRGFDSFDAYVQHVRADPSGQERLALVDALTTNHTSFFRERDHFEFLAERVVPALLAAGTSLAGWSAGCATGEEPYSLAMTLADASRGHDGCRIDLVASDLSIAALQAAMHGVYPVDRVHGLPLEILRRHFERGVNADEGLARVRTAVRQLVRFERANILDPRRFAVPRQFIFCRNTLMYFDRAARQKALSVLEANLAPNGYLFVAHAENLAGLDHGMQRIAPSVYQRKIE